MSHLTHLLLIKLNSTSCSASSHMLATSSPCAYSPFLLLALSSWDVKSRSAWKYSIYEYQNKTGITWLCLVLKVLTDNGRYFVVLVVAAVHGWDNFREKSMVTPLSLSWAVSLHSNFSSKKVCFRLFSLTWTLFLLQLRPELVCPLLLLPPSDRPMQRTCPLCYFSLPHI